MKRLLILPLLVAVVNTFSQDIDFSRKIVDTLTSSYFWGRGYTNDGMKKAADFISKQFKSYGLAQINNGSFLQEFSYPVNTFPGKMEVTINGKKLVPGKDFIVGPEDKGLKGEGGLVKQDSVDFIDAGNRCIIHVVDKLTWSASTEAADYTLIALEKNVLKDAPSSYKVNIENKLNNNFKTANVCAIVKGTTNPDSIIFITAHYDHLGGMGKDTYFPGANDNASGIALLLNLAHYYAKHPQKFSIGFICFAGEEAGLIGSRYFTENPLVPLKNIRFLINTDLAGTGEEGITVVNATEFPKEFAYMNEINDQEKLLVKIYPRGKAANSDHYFFSEKGVPAFFFYTMGGIKAYHDIFDRPETLPLNEQENLFKLIVRFNQKLMGE